MRGLDGFERRILESEFGLECGSRSRDFRFKVFSNGRISTLRVKSAN